MKWSSCQRWWDVSKDWKSFVKTAEELCKRTLERDKGKKVRDFPLIGKEDVQNEAENERHKNKMRKRETLRVWDPAWGNQMRLQILCDQI